MLLRILSCALLAATGHAARAAIYSPALPYGTDPAGWLRVTVEDQDGDPREYFVDARADDLPYAYRPVMDRVFWIRRTTPTFRVMGYWRYTDHDVSAFSVAPSLTITALPGYVYRYNGGPETAVPNFQVPEPSGCALVLLAGLAAIGRRNNRHTPEWEKL